MRLANFTLAMAVLFSLSVIVVHAEKKVVCYVGTWAYYRPGNGKFDIDSIQPVLCTHLMYGFFGINVDGTIRIIDPYLDLEDNWGRGHVKRFNDLKSKYPHLKTMAAVGGWNEGSQKFSTVAASPALRQRFIADSVAFCKKYNFDGVDLDWEYPGQRDGNPAIDKENHAVWLEEIRQAYDREGLLLSAAVASVEFSASQSYDIPRVSAALHFMNVMTYDMHGAWDDYTGLNAPLFEGPADVTDKQKQLNVNASIHYWLSQGAPKEKIVMGIPLYGRTFTLADSTRNGLGAPAIGPGLPGQYSQESGMIGYNEFCEKLLTEQWDIQYSKEYKGFYATKGNQWVGFENQESVELKMDYFAQLDLGGIMTWSLETDDFGGICHPTRYVLMSAIYTGLHGNAPSLPEPTTPPTSTTPGPNGCTGEGVFPHPQYCEKYYICTVDGYRYDFTCPVGLLFDPVKKYCNWPEDVECQT